MQIINSVFLKKNSLKLLICFLSIVLSIKIFLFHQHYPGHDEIITFDRYLRWHTFLRRDAPNNHLLLSFIGTIINSIFGFNFYLLRFVAFLSLIGIFLIYSKLFKNFFVFTLFFVTIVSSEAIFNYSYLFRGYYLSSFISVIIYYYLYKYYFVKNKTKYISIIFFLNFLLCIHALYTLYIWAPVIIGLSIFLIKEKKIKILIKNFFIYFLIPALIFYIIIITITGFSNEFSGNLNISFLYNNKISVIKRSLVPGIVAIFFDENLSTTSFLSSFETRLLTIKDFFYLFYSHTIIFLILFFSFLLAIIKILFKKINVFDLITFIFIFIFIFFNKPLSGYYRVYISFIYFFIFYIVHNLEVLLKYITFNKIFKNNLYHTIICLFILTYFLETLEINTKYSQELKTSVKKINIHKNDCNEANDTLDQYQIWILINFYPKNCYYYYDDNKKINILSNIKKNSNFKKKEISTLYFY